MKTATIIIIATATGTMNFNMGPRNAAKFIEWLTANGVSFTAATAQVEACTLAQLDYAKDLVYRAGGLGIANPKPSTETAHIGEQERAHYAAELADIEADPGKVWATAIWK